MKGTCIKCGCTTERPCVKESDLEPGTRARCGWIDPQMDLCSFCAERLMESPVEPTTLVECALMIRSLRALLRWNMERTDAIEGLLGDSLEAFAVAQGSGIWTPGGEP